MKSKVIHYLQKNMVCCGSDHGKTISITTDRDAVTCKKCIHQIAIWDDMDSKLREKQTCH
jgi:hypothetical protein